MALFVVTPEIIKLRACFYRQALRGQTKFGYEKNIYALVVHPCTV